MSLLVLMLVACGGGSDDSATEPTRPPGATFTSPEGDVVRPAPELQDVPVCNAECPAGTQLALFESLDEYHTAVARGGFLLVEGSCESLCTPIQPCFPPSVPVVTEAGFFCEALAGFSTIPADSAVDLDFGLLWQAAEHVP